MLKEGELRKGRSGRKCSPPPRRLGLRHPTEKSLSPGLRHGQLAEEGKKRPKPARPRRSEAGRAGQPGPDPHSHLAPPPRSAPTKQAGGGAGPAGGGRTGRWPVLGASRRPRGGSDPDEVTGKHRLPMARAGFPHRARETRPRDTHLSWQPSRPGPMQLWEEEEEHTCRSLSPLTLFLGELLGNRKAVCVRLLSSTEITLQLSLGEVVNPSFIMHLFICVFARQLVLSVYAVTEIVPAPNKVSFWSSSRNRFHYDFDTGVAVPQRALHCFFHR